MTPEQKNELEQFAGLFAFTREELAIIVGVSVDDPEFDTAVLRGQLISKAKLMQSKFSLAYSGSSEAQKQAQKMIDQHEKKKF
jgi:hypothetical protein